MSRLNSALLNLQTSVNQQHELANKSARAQVKEEKGEEKQSHRTNKKEEDEDGDDASSSSDDDSAPSHPGVDDSAPILVYCRIRPARNRANTANGLLTVDDETKKVEFKIPKQMDTNSGTVNNTKESFDFNFSGIFGEKTTQEEMFNGIGKRVVDNVLAGYNGTIFAYGQTGSGKTYSMTGGTDHYDDRGLIPRSLSYIFEWIEQHSSEYSVSIRISYLEVYNDAGYDLLDPQHEHKSLTELPRVTLMENDGAIHFRNLGELPASNVDEALNLLFVGETNRIVCETPSNDASTRSHCIFMVNIETRELGGTKVRRSKLNLVDLAGSERVKKTNVGGKILKEALHINVSLHYLEQVIVALHDAAAGKTAFIPYRNSMLTSVLRDSLGGNCKTVMLATISPEKGHLDESISTSRFAQRVGMIKNRAELNEEVDPYVLVKRLKGEVRDLREEVSSLRGQAKFKPLDEDERRAIRELVQQFVRDDRAEMFDEGGTRKFDRISMPNPYKVRAAFEFWKEIINSRGGGGGGGGGVGPGEESKSQPQSNSNDELIRRLQHENSLLVAALRKSQGSSAADSIIKEIQANVGSSFASSSRAHSVTSVPASRSHQTHATPSSSVSNSSTADSTSSTSSTSSFTSASTPASTPAPTPEELALSKLRADSFEQFRRTYRKHTMVEEQKSTHARKVDEARRIGESINRIRGEINQVKHRIEQHRLARGVADIQNQSAETLEPDETELQLRHEIDSLKSSYRTQFDALKHLKGEIDFLKNVIEKSRAQLQADFERWWQTQQQKGDSETHNSTDGPQSDRTSSTTSYANPPSDRSYNHSHSHSHSHSSSTTNLIANSAAIASVGASSNQHSSVSHSHSSSHHHRSSHTGATKSAWTDGHTGTNNPSTLSSISTFAYASASASAPSSSYANDRPHSSSSNIISHARVSSHTPSSSLGASLSLSSPPVDGPLPGLRTTGNSAADADIARFYAIKQQMLNQNRQQ